MDVLFFLRERTNFIRQFYETASPPFLERKRKIEQSEDPFTPPYSEDSEPPFLEEWMEADLSLQTLGHSAVSLLSAALQLYFKTWESQLGEPAAEEFKSAFKKGWINGYKTYFAQKFGIDFSESPTDLALLEEIVLVRNQAQHPDHISMNVGGYAPKKIKMPFFIQDIEKDLIASVDPADREWLSFIHVDKDNLFAAITQVEKFTQWLETKITDNPTTINEGTAF